MSAVKEGSAGVCVIGGVVLLCYVYSGNCSTNRVTCRFIIWDEDGENCQLCLVQGRGMELKVTCSNLSGTV